MNAGLRKFAVPALLFIGAACGAQAEDSPSTEADVSGDERTALGTLAGLVRDDETGEPIPGVWVSVGALGAVTGPEGNYSLGPLPAGASKLHVYRRGFRAESATVVIPGGGSARRPVSLVPADPPCCRLAGAWSARFHLDSAGLNGRPGARDLTGLIRLEPGVDSVRTRTNAGRADMDFGPLIGSEVDGRLGQGRGLGFAGDSVAITLIPSFGDWAIELLGRQAADTIRGDWYQRASCCGAYGTFVLVRHR